MKNKLLATVLLYISIFMSMQAEVVQQEVKEGWKFSQARQENWHEAKVPGEVHTDLMRENIIEDPFFGQNERSVQWVDKEDWIYETNFTPADDIVDQCNIDLVFKGLDTYADVYLNDSLILKANNMFREWTIPVKGILKNGENSLRVYFHSPIKVDLPKFDSLDFIYEACNDQSENGGILDKRLSIFARKAGYHYGWDWGPRLVTSGIWRPVILEGWSEGKIDNLFVETKHINSKKAVMEASMDIISDTVKKGRVEILDLSTGKVLKSKEITLSKGNNHFKLPFNVSNPRLWWCNGLGKPNLYDFQCRLVVDGKTQAHSKVTTGIRTVEVVREKDAEGTSFYFKLNGLPVFAKGANYIPCDNFLSRVTKEVYKQTIKDAVDVNMNMLRVWGGGIYEDDYFYELCDKNGLMIWQDFMFACSMYPAEGEMLENIRQEAVDNVVRLRNHPSIALWCGNNECLEAWYGWSWKTRYDQQGVGTMIWSQYDNLFHKTLPEVVSEYAPNTFYWPSSPFSRYDGIAEANNGDFHLWTVWGQSKPIDEYNRVSARFFSEYGFQSFPTIETVKKYAPNEKDWDINSEVMLSHQRAGQDANNRLNNYLLESYPAPKDFESLLYMTQILQGDAIRTAIEAHRRNKPYCMGSLFWQHNDCWPVASWSSRDYYGNWKAQHYFARRAYDDILISNVIKNDSLCVNIISDRKKATDGVIKLKILTLDGDIVFSNEGNLSIPADEVHALEFNIEDVIGSHNKSKLIIHTQYSTKDARIYDAVTPLLKNKDMKYESPDIVWSVSETDEDKYLELSADTFVRGLFISMSGADCRYSDNFFDLLPNSPVKVKLETALDIDNIKKCLKFTHLYSASQTN